MFYWVFFVFWLADRHWKGHRCKYLVADVHFTNKKKENQGKRETCGEKQKEDTEIKLWNDPLPNGRTVPEDAFEENSTREQEEI